MARIRTIKPEFWADEKLSPLSPIDRLVFLGLISMADDAGRVLDSVKAIDGFIFANTDDSCRESLNRLGGLGRLERGMTASGQRVLQIANWSKHQRIDKPNMASALPEIVRADSTTVPRLVADVSPTPPRQVADVSAPRPTTYDLRPTTYEQERQAAQLRALVRSQAGDSWPDLERFLDTRAPHTHANWLREFSKLTGPGSQFLWADLAVACSDALGLDQPLAGPHALRAFIAKARAERLKPKAGDPSPTAAAAQVGAVERRREGDYFRARKEAAERWATDHPDEAARVVAEIEALHAGQADNPITRMAKETMRVSRLADASGFPKPDDPTPLAATG